MTRQRLAIAVFVDVEAVDIHDARAIAENAIRRKLSDDTYRRPVVIPSVFGPDVRVVDVRDVGVAAGNGHLWTRPTSLSWRDCGIDDDEPSETVDDAH